MGTIMLAVLVVAIPMMATMMAIMTIEVILDRYLSFHQLAVFLKFRFSSTNNKERQINLAVSQYN